MLNKSIAVLMSLCLVIAPMAACADDLVLPPKGKITGLNYGQKAPYTGVLLNGVAAAKLLTDKRFSEEQWKLKLDFELAKEAARLGLIINSQKVSIEALNKKHTTLMKIKDDEIERLSKIASNTNDYSIWWATGGVIIGIGLTLAVVYVAKEI